MTWNDDVARRRVHGTHGEVVAARAERDRAALLALPAVAYLVVQRTRRRVARDGMFSRRPLRVLPDPASRSRAVLGSLPVADVHTRPLSVYEELIPRG